MQLFFQPHVDPNPREVTFSREESKHILKVLRKKIGQLLYITDGKGKLYKTEIISAEPNKCVSKIIDIEETVAPAPSLHLAVAPTKMNSRFEWFLEKATEIGIQEITPIICAHSERKSIKPERFQRVLQSAMKQSLHTWLPKLNPAILFSDFMKKDHGSQNFIAHCEDENEKNPLFKQLKTQGHITVLIGPEGDFSLEELKIAKNNHWSPVSLGNSRLRTETAAIVACHTVALFRENS